MFYFIFCGALCFFLCYGRLPVMPLLLGSAALGACCAILGHQLGHRHGAFLSIDSHAQRSRLSGCHPALKAAFAIGCMLVCVAVDMPAVSLFVAASMALLTVCAGKTSLRYYLSLLALPALFILFGTLALLFEFTPAPLGLLDLPVGRFYLSVTAAGQIRAFSTLCRALGALSCLYLLSLSTPVYQLIALLRRARVPAVIVELMYLIYRYIFVLLEMQGAMHMAAASRLGYRDRRTTVKTTLNSSLNLLFLSFRRSSDCFAAMESRCYEGEIAFLERDAALRSRELLAAVAYGIVLFALCILSKRGGL